MEYLGLIAGGAILVAVFVWSFESTGRKIVRSLSVGIGLCSSIGVAGEMLMWLTDHGFAQGALERIATRGAALCFVIAFLALTVSFFARQLRELRVLALAYFLWSATLYILQAPSTWPGWAATLMVLDVGYGVWLAHGNLTRWGKLGAASTG